MEVEKEKKTDRARRGLEERKEGALPHLPVYVNWMSQSFLLLEA